MVSTGWMDGDGWCPRRVLLGLQDAGVCLCDGLELHKCELSVSYEERILNNSEFLTESENVLFLHLEADSFYENDLRWLVLVGLPRVGPGVKLRLLWFAEH